MLVVGQTGSGESIWGVNGLLSNYAAADGDVVDATEAERSNNDTLRGAPPDFDKMAACEPDRTIWMVEGRTEGHEVIRTLHNPSEGEPRVEKTYSESSPLRE